MADKKTGIAKILRINLSAGAVCTDVIEERIGRKFLGGAGFVTYFLFKELKPDTDPLSPDNKLVLACGPITGLLPGSSRHCIGAKSPLTGTIAKSEVGGRWGTELKRAGYDAVIIEGKAERPVYLWIRDGEASIIDASNLWGMNTKETQQILREAVEDNTAAVACIGPGGENLIRYACIMHGLNNTAGRGGLGAVMGSKNLKAIAVRGHKKIQVFDRERFTQVKQSVIKKLHLVDSLHNLGTGGIMEHLEQIGNLPVRNFRDGSFPEVKKIDAQAIRDTIRIGMDGCYGCPVRCKKIVEAEAPYPIDGAYGGPEYETLAALGSNCGIDDVYAISKGNELCNAYSLDTISVGAVIAFAMECFENGLLTTKDTGGVELKFGNARAMLSMIEAIVRREGIGDILAEGTVKASDVIGRGASKFAMHTKKLELGMHEPRLKPGLGLGFMVNPHGGDHCTNIHDDYYVTEQQVAGLQPLGILEPVARDDIGPRKVLLFKLIQQKAIISDCLLTCTFVPYSAEQLAEATASVTGWNTNIMDQFYAAERILTLARLFNIREGFTDEDDKLPQRFFQSIKDGPLTGTSLDPVEMDKAKRYYYSLMGWDRDSGIPTREKLEELGLIWEQGS